MIPYCTVADTLDTSKTELYRYMTPLMVLSVDISRTVSPFREQPPAAYRSLPRVCYTSMIRTMLLSSTGWKNTRRGLFHPAFHSFSPPLIQNIASPTYWAGTLSTLFSRLHKYSWFGTRSLFLTIPCNHAYSLDGHSSHFSHDLNFFHSLSSSPCSSLTTSLP